MIQKGKVYPLASEYRFKTPSNVRAVWTGEKRYPRKGEWFLSGALVEAYLSPSTLTHPYHIAKLVLVETREVVVGDYNGRQTPPVGRLSSQED